MTEKLVRLLCPNLRCKTLLSVPGNARGKIVRCRQCGTRIRIPQQGGSPQTVAAPAATPETAVKK